MQNQAIGKILYLARMAWQCAFGMRFAFLSVGAAALFSGSASAQLLAVDGEYVGWEETIRVKNGKVVACRGWAFDQHQSSGYTLAKCKGYKFSTSKQNIIKAVPESNPSDIGYFCLPPAVEIPRASCGPNGWKTRPIVNQ